MVFFQGDSKKYFTSNIANWMRQNHEKILEQFFEKKKESGITTELMFLDL